MLQGFIAQHAAKLYSLLGRIFIAKIEEQISFGLVLRNTIYNIYNYYIIISAFFMCIVHYCSNILLVF